MVHYIFLTETNLEGAVTYYAIHDDKIEVLKESDTYDRYGQIISASEAGNSVLLKTQKAVDIANQAYHDYHAEYDDTEVVLHYSLYDTIYAFESSSEYDAVIDSSELDKDVDYSIESPWVKGFNYWDGSNWRTVVVEHENGNWGTHVIVDDEELIEELNQAIEDKEYVKSEFGKEKYQSGSWEIVDNHCQGSWATFEIREAETNED